MGSCSWSALFPGNQPGVPWIEGAMHHPQPWREAPGDIRARRCRDPALSRSSTWCSISFPACSPITPQFPPGAPTPLQEQLTGTSGARVPLLEPCIWEWCQAWVEILVRILFLYRARIASHARVSSKFGTNFLSGFSDSELKLQPVALPKSGRFNINILIRVSEFIQAAPIFSAGGPKK